MPFIEVHYLEPRSEEQRERLAKAITDDVVEIFEVPREAVWIKFSEMPQSHFSKGGVLWNKR
ncbi:4-oxalocrotonate tautomerase family protein [Candidatus Bathyarchaeota archaeon]|jgi:4-oxalocrotonate tautomerase|nr:4-oxalocrotonate tautomerase family protein [Candidatus Bathyarchaeota archaeon]